MSNNTMHSIKAHLYENVLTENPNDYVARVNSERSLNVKDICESAVSRGGADVSAAAMEHGVTLWLKEMGYRLCDGFSINAGWFTASAHVRGVFDSPNEQFSREKHTLLFEFHQGSLLRGEAELVDVQILGVAASGLYIAQVTDVKTGSINDRLTPNRNLKIAGNKMKIAGDSDINGVFFVNIDSGVRTKVDQSDIVVNNPAEVIVVIPELAAGSYRLEITTQYGGNSMHLLKEPRTTVFEKILTVL